MFLSIHNWVHLQDEYSNTPESKRPQQDSSSDLNIYFQTAPTRFILRFKHIFSPCCSHINLLDNIYFQTAPSPQQDSSFSPCCSHINLLDNIYFQTAPTRFIFRFKHIFSPCCSHINLLDIYVQMAPSPQQDSSWYIFSNGPISPTRFILFTMLLTYQSPR
jgi:hypothetical protein